jgi:hypothetical protein
MKGKGTYTLDDFFRVSKDVDLPGRQVRVRTLSEAEVQSRLQEATRASLRRKQELTRPDAEERLLMLAEHEALPLDELREALATFDREAALLDAQVRTHPDLVILPDEATEEERLEIEEQRQAAVTAWMATVEQAGVQAYQARQQRQEAPEAMRAELLQRRLLMEYNLAHHRTFEDWTLYYATWDGDKPYFKDAAATRLLPPAIRQTLLAAYNEVSGVDPWDMENFFGMGACTAPSVSSKPATRSKRT